MGEHITVGTGTGTGDAAAATAEAIEAAREDVDGDGTFTVLYCSSEYDPEAVAAAAEPELSGERWIAISTDQSFVCGEVVDRGVAALSLASDYIHVGISVADEYRDDPEEKARAATQAAMEEVEVDNYVEAYAQFKRTQTGKYEEIVRTPPYFMLVYPSGTEIKDGEHVPGDELSLIEGIVSHTGPHIPIFGGSASSRFDEYVAGEHAENFQIVDGAVYDHAAIIVFVVCNLYFENTVRHGYTRTDKIAVVTELADNGHDILEINGEEPVAEYARLLDISKEELLADPVHYCLEYPFAMVDFADRALVREALPNDDGETLHATFSVPEGAALNILAFDEEETLDTLPAILDEQSAEMLPAVSLLCECVGRKPLIDDIQDKEMDRLRDAYDFPVFGFYSFGEIGSYGTRSPQAHSQTVTSLAIYDRLLTEM